MNNQTAATPSVIEQLEPRKLFAGTPAGNVFSQTNLVSNGPVAAAHTDADLKNPWGLAISTAGVWWVADNGTGNATLYDKTGNKLSPTVKIPGGGGAAALPTGQVANTSSAFMIHKGTKSAPAEFIFAGEDGGISGWSSKVNATNAILAVDNSASGAVYKGLTMGSVKHKPRLYATNFRAGRVEMYDGAFKRISSKTAFKDNNIPAGYTPFNVQNLNGLIYVTYALRDSTGAGDVAGRGHGFVDIYSTSGVLLRRFVRGKYLNSPWGLAIAPASFGPFAGDVLVGQFGSGVITAINPKNGKLVGILNKADGTPVHNQGLWSLTTSTSSDIYGTTDALYFTAGPNDEADGLFGTVQIA
jgi:uncharacterized protein (TIGR03118 family)